MKRQYERSRPLRASSVLSTYSTQLQKVMVKMPMTKLSPPFRSSGAAIMNKKLDKKGRVAPTKIPIDQNTKTFFKGATSFFLQAESSVRIQQNDQAIRNYLGIDNRKADPGRNQQTKSKTLNGDN